ncbi:hypothetical protein [Pedobacter panaciterrae]|jgi:hypothetical protein|uniref:Uncharacterized protein n=1 Tax=Pedobacter panaciterrae TaxID=363849 RepID=A0ABU8NPR3_9SPHI|nr:hypothetical protein [Pedobacter panaciterrae]NQX54544.1 hypothetical protein [Pedobacter panaciterrae]
MKKILTLLSALLIVTGLKAQKIVVQKETVKPKADTLAKSSVGQQSNKAIGKKDAKIAPAIKYASTSKVAPASTKMGKLTPVN